MKNFVNFSLVSRRSDMYCCFEAGGRFLSVTCVIYCSFVVWSLNRMNLNFVAGENFGKRDIFRGDSAGFSAEVEPSFNKSFFLKFRVLKEEKGF